MKKILRFNYYLWIGLFLVLLSAGNMARAAAFTAIQSGNWDDPATWGSLSFPGLGDDITINAGVTVTMSVDGTCTSITDMPGGIISGPGILTIAGSAGVAISDISGIALISCPLILPVDASITVSGTLTISGVISGAANNLIKSGAGKLILSGTNLYDGVTTVNEGILNLQNGQGAGTPVNGIIVHDLAQLELESTPMMFIDEDLSLSGEGITGGALKNVSGTNVWLGDIDIDGADTRINSTLGDFLLFGAINLKENLLTFQGISDVFIPGVIYTSTGTGSIAKEDLGVLSFGNQAFSINSLFINGGTFISTSGTINLAGDFIHNTGVFDNNGGTVNFNGSALQSIGGSQQTAFNNLILDNPYGASLGNSLSVDGILTLANGWLKLGSNNLTLGSAAVAGSPSVSNMIITDGTGECRRIFEANGSYLFPIGEITGTPDYSPITLNFTTGTFSSGAYAGVKVTDGQHPQDHSATDFLTRYWSVTQTGISSFTYDVTGTFTNTIEDITGNIANIITGMWTGSAWQNYNSVTAPDISATGVTGTGDFTGISNTSSQLPTITLGSIPGICIGSVAATLPYTGTTNSPDQYSISWDASALTAGFSDVPLTSLPVSPIAISVPSGAPADIYSGTIIVFNSLSGSSSIGIAFTITINSLPTASITGQTNVSCIGNNTGAIDLTITGGTPGYSFSWIKDGSAFASTSEDLSGLGAASYIVVIQDANSCESETTINITQPDELNLNLTQTAASCPGISNGSISAAISGTPISDLEINIDGGAFSTVTANPVIFNGLTSGNHTIILHRISDDNCSVTQSEMVTEPDALGLVLTPTHATCFGGNKSISAVVSGTPLSDLEINMDGGAFSTIAASPVVFNGLTSGNHTFILRRISDTGCSVTQSESLSEPDAIGLVLTPTIATCFGGNQSISAAISGTPISDLEINLDGGAFSTVTANPVIFNGLTSGNHTIILHRISDENCSVTQSEMVTEPDALGLVLTPSHATCFGGNKSISAAISGTPISDLEINMDGGAFSTIAASPVVFNGLTSGNHTFILRRISDTGCSVTQSEIVTEPDALGLVLTPSHATCFGGNKSISAVVSGTPLSDLEINMDGGAFSTIAASPVVFNGLTSGNHTFILRRISDTGCSVTQSESLSEPDAIGLVLTPTIATCFGGNQSISAAISGTPISDLEINLDGGAFSTIATSPVVFNGLTSGNHTFILRRISDDNCSVTQSEMVTEPDALGLVLTPSHATCFGGNKSISAAISGTPISDLEINLDGGAFSTVAANPVVFNGLSAGNHTIILHRISDDNCSVTQSEIVTEPDALGLVLTPSHATCFGGNKSISAAISGTSISDLEINLDGGAFSTVASSPVVLSGLSAGNHTIILRRISDNGCSVTQSESVTEPDILTAGSVGIDQTICYNAVPDPLNDIVPASGGNGTYSYQWQSSPTGSAPWNDISGATSSTFSPGQLTTTIWYRRSVTSGSCGTVFSTGIKLTVYPSLTAGTVGNNQNICYNTTPAGLTQLTAPAGGVGSYTYQWQSSTDNLSWTDISGAISSSYSPGNLTTTLWYRRSAMSGSCGSVISNTIKITVYDVLFGGSIGSDQAICYNTQPAAFTNDVSPSGGTNLSYQWQQKVGAGSWNNIPSATGLTYAISSNLTQTTQFRRSVFSGSACGTVYSNEITITVYPNLTSGTLGTSQTICYNTNPAGLTELTSASGGTGSYTYQWESSPDNSTWTSIAGATSGNYSPVALMANMYFRRIATSGSCGSATSTGILITVRPNLTAPTASVNRTICYNTVSPALTSTTATGGSGTFSYQWQTSPDNITWTNIAGANNYSSYTPPALTSTTYNRLIATATGIPACGTVTSNVITITVLPELTSPVASADQTICYNASPAQLTSTAASGGNETFSYQWYSSLNNSSWSVISGATGLTYQPSTLTTSTYYHITATTTGSPACGNITSNSALITVYPNITAGTIGSAQTICYNSIPTGLTELTSATGGTGSYTYQWESSPDNSTWTLIAGATSGNYSPVALMANMYFRRIATSGSCGSATSTGILITVRPNLTAPTASVNRTICYNTVSPALTSTTATGGSGTFSYQWQTSPDNITWTNIAGANNYSSYTPPALTSTTYYRLIATATGIPACGTVTSNAITITVLPELTSPVASSDQTICYNTAPLQLASTAASGGNETFSYQWYSSLNNSSWSVISGATGLTYQPSTLTASTYYHITATTTGSPACGNITSSSVLITVYPNITAGTIGSAQTICYNTIPTGLTELTSATGGTGSYTYQWESSPDNSTWTSIPAATSGNYSPVALTANMYFRRIVTSGSCGSATSTGILITVRPNLTAPIASVNRTICYNTVPAALTSTTATGGGGLFTYQWQTSPDNITWTNIAGANNYSSYTPPALTSTTYYRLIATATGIPACGTVISNAITITVLPELTSPVASSDQTICYNTAPLQLASTAASGGNETFSYQWYSSLNNSSWSVISGATGLTYQPSTLTASTYYHITATTTGSPACGNITSSSVLITVYPNITAGTIGSAQTICYNTIPTGLTELTSASGGTASYTYQWESSPDNSTWTSIPGATSGNYSPVALMANMYFRRIATSGSCGSATSTGILITVRPNLTAPTASVNRTICYNTVPAALTSTIATGGGGLFAYQWQTSPDNITWTNIAGAYNYSSYTPPALTSTSYYRLVATANGTPACGTVTSNVITITVLPELTSPVASSDQTICYNATPAQLTSTAATGGNETFSYQWYSSLNNSSWSVISGATGLTYQPSTLTTSTYYHITATTTGSPACGNITSNSVLVTVYPSPVATATPAAQTICSGTTSSIALSGAIAGTTFSWTVAQTDVSGATAGSGNSIAQNLSTTGIITGTAIYTITPTANGCNGATNNVVISVKPTPVALASPLSQTRCSGIPISIALTSNVSGTFFAWTVIQSGVSGALAGSGATISQTLTATGITSGTATYSVIPTANGCAGPPVTVVVTVNPSPVATVTPSSQTICSGTGPSISLSSNIAGTTFAWTVAQSGVTGASPSSGSTISQTLTALGATAGIATYTITPSASGCSGSTKTIVITVNPSPVVTATPALQTICSGAATSIALSSPVAGTTFDWTYTVAPVGSITGASGGSGNSIAQSLENTTLSQASVTYTVVPKANSCSGNPINVIVTVNPAATLSSPLLNSVCSNELFSYIPTSNIPLTTFSWKRDAVLGIQNAANSGTASVNETLINYTGVPITLKYIYTLNTYSCTIIQNVFVTVNPTPTLASSVSPPSVCSNSPFIYNAVSSVNPGTTITWTRAVVPGISNPAGSGTDDIHETLINTSAIDVVVPYTFSLSVGSCTTSSTVNATIKPTPTVTVPANLEYCKGDFVPAIVFTGTVTGTTYIWGNNNTTIGLAANGTGNISAFTAGNISSNLTTATISVRPNVNGCDGANSAFTISVFPASQGGIVNTNMSVCSGSNSGTLTLSGQTGTVTKWQSSTDGGANWTDISNTTISQNYTNLVLTTKYRAVVQSGICAPANSSVATITVNQSSVGGIVTADANVCYGTNSGSLNLSGQTGTIIKWQSSINGGTTWSDISNISNAQSFINLTITTQYRAVVQNASCVLANSSFATITVDPASVGGNISGSAVVCSGTNTTTLTLSGYTGSITKWQSSTVSDFSSGVTDIANSTSTLTAVNLVLTTYYRAILTSGVCSQTYSSDAIITINPLPIASAGGSQTICSTGTATVSGAIAANGTILWTENGAGAITAGATTLTPTYTASAGDAGNQVILTMTVTSTNVCAPQSATANYSVNIDALPAATAGGSQTICSNGTATVSGATATNGSIFWTENGAGSITSGATTLTPVYTAALADAGTTVTLTMTVTSNNACSPQTATSTYAVIVKPLPTATAGGSQTICSTGTATVSGASITNGTILWTEDGAGSITAGANTLTPTYTSVAADAGTTVTLTMTVTSNNACAPQTATATYSVIVNQTSLGGSISGSTTVCSGTNTTILTLSGYAGSITKWQSSTVSNFSSGVTDIANTTNSLVVTNLNTTTWYRAVVQNGTCPVSISSTANITVNPTPNLVITNPAPVCTPGTVNLTLPAVTTGSTLPAGTILTYWIDAAATMVYATPTTANADVYWIKATTPANCFDVEPVTVSVYSTLGALSFDLGVGSTICKGSAPMTFTATAVNALSISYSLDATSLAGGNTINVNTGRVVFAVGYTGTIEITATATGCGGSKSQRIYTIIVDNQPTVTFPNPASPICEGTPITLSANSTSGATTLKTFTSPIITLNQAIPESRAAWAGSITNITENTGLTIAATDIIEVTVNINHINNDQLDLFLIGPNGGSMLLSSDNAGTGDNYDNALLRTGYIPNITTLGNTTVSGAFGTEGNVSTLASQLGGNGGSYGNTAVPQTKIVGSPINGNWEIRVFDDFTGTGTGILKDWSITIKKAVPSILTTVFSGPGASGTTYSGTTPVTASQTLNPPAGTNVYTATTSDENGCSTVKTVTVVVNPLPTPTITADYCIDRSIGKVRLTTSVCTSCTYLWNTHETNNSIDVDLAGTYTVTVTNASGCSASSSVAVAQELVVNGDFSAGNTGFTSDYAYKIDQPGLVPAGQGELYDDSGINGYSIVNNGQNVHTNFFGIDHTQNVSGNKNFMIVNGHGTLVVWKETVTIQPNTDYYFAAWAMSVNTAGNYARLQFAVNGTPVGTIATLVAGPGSTAQANVNNYWTRFYSDPKWNSGALSGPVTISIIDLNTVLPGNDFALDDISFGTLANVPFSFTASNDSPKCSRETVQLTSAVSGGKPPIVYNWTGPNGYISHDANPVLSNISYSDRGNYFLSVLDYYNCTVPAVSTIVTLDPTPEIPNQTISICNGSAFNATPVDGIPNASTFVPANTAYTWAAPVVTGGITGGTAGSGSTSITGTLTNPTTTLQTATYTVTPFTYTGTPASPKCTGLPFSVVVSVYPNVSVSAGANRSVCSDAPGVTLTGSYGGAATSASWTGGTTANFNPNRNTPTAVYTPTAAEIASGTVTLTLTTNDPAGPCGAASSSMTITIGAMPVLSTVPTQVKCFGANTGAINLTVTGGGASPTYVWKRSNGTTVATTEDLSGLVADTYTVVVTGTNNCTATTSVTITQPAAALTASAVVTGVLCAGNTTGTVTLTVNGGTTNYAYSWTGSGGGVVPVAQVASKNLTGLVSGNYTVLITDANSCTFSLSSTVTVAANTIPVITTCPVARNFNGCATTAISGPAYSALVNNSTYAVFSDGNNKGVANDNCAITTVTYQDAANTSCPINITRTWTIGDASGLITTCQQTITVTDVVAPVWTNAPGALNRSVECSDAAGLAAAQILFPTASDACDADVSNSIKTSGAFIAASGCSQSGTYTNTWRVTDECGNISLPYTQVITVTDNAAPTWTTATGSLDRTMECGNIIDLAAAQALVPLAMDNCDAVVTNVIKVAGAFVSGGVCSQVGTYTNTWTVADDCGNVSTVFTQHINITDNTAPVWLSVPGEINRTLECNNASGLADAQALYPVASDNCATIAFSDIHKISGSFIPSMVCAQQGTYTNTWTVSDGCGNLSVAYTQLITIEDNSGPVVSCPSNRAFSCDSPLFSPSVAGTAIAIDNCDKNPSLTWADNIVPGGCAGNYQIIRTWTAADACGKSNTCEQTIFVQDVTAPIITCAFSGNQNVYPDPAVAFVVPDNSWDATATDNCSGVTITATLSGSTISGLLSTLDGVSFNEGVTTVTWTATDGCGISSTCQNTVTVIFKPEISCPADITHNNDADLCSANFDPGFPVLSVVTSPITYGWTLSGATIGSGTGLIGYYTFNKGVTTITWMATNIAGTGVCTQTITVVDIQPPTFVASADVEYCVLDIYQAEFDAPTIDITPARPDYYVFKAGTTDLDLNPVTFGDNCPQTCSFEMRWRIDFQDGTFLPAVPDTYITGQPSDYGVDIRFPGDAILNIPHHITYQVVDCSGNVSSSKTVGITIKPRPDVIKKTE